MYYQNIKNNSIRQLDSKLYSANYYDFMIHRGETKNLSLLDLDEMLIADFSTFDIANGTFYSTKTWSAATSEGVDLEDIGLTGVDNGFIHFRKDMISNEEFLKLYLNSKYSIESGDTRLFLNPITGNTQMFSYPMYLVDGSDKYIAYKGGFYQGFFKLDGFGYQVLPEHFNQDITFHFEIRPRSDYKADLDSVNHLHPENEGIFFYLGTRAENKFWPFYKTSSAVTETLKKQNARTEGYFSGCGDDGETYDLQNHIVSVKEWLLDEPEEEKEEGYFAVGDSYFSYNPSEIDKVCTGKTTSFKPGTTYLNTYDFNPDSNCSCGKPTPPSPSGDCSDYYADDYLQKDVCGKGNKAFDEEYVQSETLISTNPNDYEDSDGHALGDTGFYEFETDNKFLLFDRTASGFTTDNWVEGTKVKFIGRKPLPNVNYFLLMNRTETGYTVDTIDQYNQEHGVDYNIYKDIRNNAFALKITENGAIGYRYGALDCDDEENTNKYKVIEEYSKDGLVNPDEWNSINVKFAILNPSANKCDKREKKMRIMFYVNGFLVFISKEMPALSFKALDEVSQKQEGVPYSISLGGGTLGLLETIVPDYYQISDYVLPIEQDFCGTFLGDIRSFKIYYGDIDYFAIRNYLS